MEQDAEQRRPDGDATWQTLIELNTGANDPADIYYNYRDTAVGDTFFDSGGRATVGLKDVGNQIGANARRLLISQDNKQAVSGSAFGIFQSTTPSRDVIITVNNVPPTIGAQENIEIPEGTRLTRTINFTDPSGQAAGTGDSFDYVITYGDGTDPLFDKLDQGTRSFVFDHVYADDGNYQVSLDLRDDDTGVASQVVFTVRVTNVRPALAITGSTRLIRPQQEVSFTDEPGLAKFNDVGFTYAPAGTREVFTYIIDWGDGTVQQFSDFAGVPGGPGVATTGSIFGKHTYLFGGEFVVQIKVADDDMQAANPNDFVVGTVLVEVGSKGLVVAGADVGGGPLVVAYNTRIGGAPGLFVLRLRPAIPWRRPRRHR